MTLPTEFPENHAQLYDLLQKLFGLGNYDDVVAKQAWHNARMGEISRLKSLCTRRRATPKHVAVAAYYAEPEEADHSRASEWVRANVLPNLTGPTKPRAEIPGDLLEFVGDSPEFWAWYADYDWVALCQLFGTMMDLPAGWPMYCRDLKQVCDERGTRLTQGDSKHNALGDAQWLANHGERLLCGSYESYESYEVERHGHEIVWEFDRDCTIARAVCHEPPGADCRLAGTPGCECESLAIERDPDGTPYHLVEAWGENVRHEMGPVDYCNVCEWLNESGVIDELGESDRFEIGRTRIEPVWTGDGYDWKRAR